MRKSYYRSAIQFIKQHNTNNNKLLINCCKQRHTTTHIHKQYSLQYNNQSLRYFSSIVDKAVDINLSQSDQQLCDDILNENRYALSRGITLVESTKPDDRKRCTQILTYLIQKTSQNQTRNKPIFKIGITGMYTYHIAYHCNYVIVNNKAAILIYNNIQHITPYNII